MNFGKQVLKTLLDSSNCAIIVALMFALSFLNQSANGQNREALPTRSVGTIQYSGQVCNAPECQLARRQAQELQIPTSRFSNQPLNNQPQYQSGLRPVFTSTGFQNPGPAGTTGPQNPDRPNLQQIPGQLGPNSPQVGPVELGANQNASGAPADEYYDGGTNRNGLQNQSVMPQVNMDYLSQLPTNVGSACPTCATRPQFQTCTVYVPYWETNYVTTWETRYRQEPRFRPYTVYRTLTHQVPVAIDYQVMVPQQKSVQYTVYKTFQEKEPRVENYQVYVPVQKFRNVTTYKTIALRQDEVEFYKVLVPVTRTRKIQYYRTQAVRRKMTKEYTRYVTDRREVTVPAYRKVPIDPTPIERIVETMVPVDRVREEKYTVREPVSRDQTQTTTRVVPYTENVTKTITENIPYVDQEERTYQVKVPVPREETRKYYVTVPRYRNVEQRYTVMVPKVENRQAYRTVYRQVPQTYYRVYTKDCGYWKTTTETVNDCHCSTDPCGCGTSCCPITRTICRTTWCPRIVTERVPVTVHHTVAQQVPYTYQVTQMVPEEKKRVFPIVQFEQEERTVIETVYDYNTETRTELLSIAKVKKETRTVQVPVQKYREVPEKQSIPVTEFRTVEKTRQVPYQELVKQSQRVKVVPNDVSYRTVEYFVKQEVEYQRAVVEPREYFVTEYINVPAERTETFTVLESVTRSRSIPKTVYKRIPTTTQVGYTVMVPETRTRLVYQTSTKRIPELNERTYTVMVPETRTRIEYKTETKKVPEQRLQQYMVNIPYRVPRHTPVRSCKLVPKQVQVPTSQCNCGNSHQMNQGQPHVGNGASPLGQYFGATNPRDRNRDRQIAEQPMPPAAAAHMTPELRQVRDAYGRLIGESILAGYQRLVQNN